MKKIWTFIIKIAIALLIIAYLIHNHYDSFVDSFKNFQLIWLLPAVVILYAEMTACAFRWYCLLKMIRIDISFRAALSLTMRGYFCSLVLPGGAIGGDVAKIGMIAHAMQKGERFEPGLSILIDRIVGMIALFGTAILMIGADYKSLLEVDLSGAGIDKSCNIFVIIFAALISFAGIAAAAMLFAYRTVEKVKLFKFIFEKADKITHGLVTRMKLAIDLYNKQWKAVVWLTVGSIFFVHLIQMPVLYFICRGLNIEIASFLTLTTAIIIGNIAGLIPLTPGGIGLRDMTIFAILQAGGFAEAAPIPVLMSLVLIICNVSAGLFFFDKGIVRNVKYKESCTV